MKRRSAIARLLAGDRLNFVVTNYLPRRSLSRLAGWFSAIDNPLLCRVSIAAWRLFTDLDLSDAEETRFRSLRSCFTRRLKQGARPVDGDPAVLVSPCDAIIGACGRVTAGMVLQAKGMEYSLGALLGDDADAGCFEDGIFVTLRLTSAMYHRFHAPADLRIDRLRHVWGDRWNVNPPSVARVRQLYCRNERAVIGGVLASGRRFALVPVAAILVGGIKLAFAELGRPRKACLSSKAVDVGASRGEELGWFEHGSTIIMVVAPGYRLADGMSSGMTVRFGQALLCPA